MGSIKDRNGMDLTEAEDIKNSGNQTNCGGRVSSTEQVPALCMYLAWQLPSSLLPRPTPSLLLRLWHTVRQSAW